MGEMDRAVGVMPDDQSRLKSILARLPITALFLALGCAPHVKPASNLGLPRFFTLLAMNVRKLEPVGYHLSHVGR